VSQSAFTYERARWQVRVHTGLGEPPAGGGLYCPDGHVITCAHVISPSGERPAGPVYVSFQEAGSHELIPAVVADDGWWPPSGKGNLRGDVAVLRLTAPAPAEAEAPPLCRSPEGVRVAHAFRAYGYPPRYALGGVPVRGKIVGQAEIEWLSLLADVGGQGLHPGFSGSPVWDVELGSVVGIVGLCDIPRFTGDRRGDGSRTAYAIRMEAIGQYWPPLQPAIVRALSSDNETLSDLLEVGPTDDGALPAVIETSVYDMGVTRSKYVTADNPTPEYVPRSRVDAEIADLLEAGERFVVAVGDSKSGKSRSLAEMLHRLRPRARLIVPAAGDPAALSKLAMRPLPLGPEVGVLWLDDIDRYLVPNGLDHKVLRSFLSREPRVTIAGTITSRRHHDIMFAGDDPTRQFAQVLSQAKLVRVASALSPEDLAAAQERYPDEDFQSRGIGEQMVAADLVEQLYDAAREALPEGWAVIQAAVDWRRIGVSSPVSREILGILFRRYLPEVAPHLEPDEDRFAVGLSWANTPLVGTIALLTAVRLGQEGAGYQAFDYLVACADGQGPFEPVPIASSAWDVAISSLDPDELLVVTQAAAIRGEVGIAMRAAEVARSRSADPVSVARAALFLGEMHGAAGQRDSAIKLLEEAAASGVTDVVPAAQAILGALLSLAGGDPDRARVLLRSAIDAGDAQVRARAQLNLGSLLMNQGALAEARPLLEAALTARADLDDTPFVGLSQGSLEPTRLSREATDDRAQMLLEAALSSGNPDVEPLARTNLGLLLQQHGDLSAARDQFERVITSGNNEFVMIAKIALGNALIVGGNAEGGFAMLEEVAASDSIDQAPHALCVLGELYLDRGEKQVAAIYFEHAIQTGHPDWAPYARVDLGLARADDGDRDGARELLETVIVSGHQNESARAADLLGDALLQAGDISGAEEAYRRAIELRHPRWSAVATTGLARIRLQQDAVQEASSLLRSVIDADHPEAAPMAADMLGSVLRSKTADADGARAAYQHAIDSGHPDWSVAARFNLAEMLSANGDQLGARAQYDQIIQGPSLISAARAWDLLGNMLAGSGDAGGARDAYRRAIDLGAAEWSATAQVDLARLILAETDDANEAEPLLTAAAIGGTTQVAASARLLLGMIALHRGERDRAREEFRHAAETGPDQVAEPALAQIAKLAMGDGDLDTASSILEHLLDNSADQRLGLYAAAHLGIVRLRQGDPKAALDLLKRGAASADPAAAAYAYLNWGLALFDLGDVDDAGELMTRALETGQSDVVNSARAALGVVRLAQNRLGDAYSLLATALESGNAEVEPRVRRYLGSVLARQGRPDDAKAVLEPLAASNDTEYRPAALLLLGRLALLEKDLAAARRWLAAAIEAGDSEVEADARVELSLLLAETADLEDSREILTPLLDQHGSARTRAGEILSELTADDRTVPQASPSAPREPSRKLNARLAKLFISYSHKDERHLKRLTTHLANLRREGLIVDWHDHQILAGDEWRKAIEDRLETADCVLLLISPDYLESEYCYNIEMERALDRYQEGLNLVIPVIVRPADWRHTRLSDLQVLPKDGKPVVEWSSRDRAWLDVVTDLRLALAHSRHSND
jgi:cellulose synthase operon protein C